MKLRIGQGYDIHRMKGGQACIIGGIHIPHPFGPMGHSDGDPLLHAIIDAILGALGKGDIGQHFPDTDPRWKGADSSLLLTQTVSLMKEEGFGVINLDSSVIAEMPKIGPHRQAMQTRIAELLGCSPTVVNVKGKTNERVDAIGKSEAIAAQVVILLASK